MRPFRYAEPDTLDEAVSLLSGADARVIAGGSDLLSEMKEGVESPATLVSLAGIEELRRLEVTAEGVRIGAMVSLADIAAHEELQRRYPVLTEAAAGVATPQVRNVAALGGNLCQRPRCFYYRSPLTRCLKKGGETCLALAGDTRHLCVMGGDRCYIVHPSDMAVALVSLDAEIELAGPEGRRAMPLQQFFLGPGASMHRENVLEPGEIVASVSLPLPAEGGRSAYLKAREREAGDFALVSVAVSLSVADGRTGQGRVVLGGVAPYPYRARDAEACLSGMAMADVDPAEAGNRALAGATPLRHNGYKVELASNLVKLAVARVLAGGGQDSWDGC